MEYLKLLMAPHLTDLVIPYNISGQQEACSLLTLTHCPVKTHFKILLYTYQSDHVLPNGSVSQSAIDHVYSNEIIRSKLMRSLRKYTG